MSTAPPIRRRRPRLGPALAVIACACIAPSAFAGLGDSGLRSSLAEAAGPSGQPGDENGESERPEPNVAPAEAGRRASREYGGRVLNVVLEDGPGGPYYRVKLLDGGRVRVVHVEARH